MDPAPVPAPIERPHEDEIDIAVHCSDVMKAYGAGNTRVLALRGVDLNVRTGEMLMLVGPSGCGKTTLISVIAGILDQDAGECLVFGEDFRRMRTRDKTHWRGRNIGFVFQSFNLLPTLTAVENVAVPLLIQHQPRAMAMARASALLERVGLKERLRSLPSQLSGGQQQRVAIARALVHGPRLIVCDEPTSALDHETGSSVMGLLREIARGENRALVIVTHDARIFPYADRLAQMDDGRIKSISAGQGAAPPQGTHP